MGASRFPQKHKWLDLCGERPEMWTLFQDSSLFLITW